MNEAAGIHSFSATEMVRFGWETFKKNPWMLLAVLAVGVIVSMISSFLVDSVVGDDSLFVMDAAAFIIDFIVQTFVGLGFIAVALAAHDRIETISVSDLWAPEHFWRYLAATILSGIIVFLGFIALIVPGIFLAVILVFTTYAVVDRGLGPIEAMKESARITRGSRWGILRLLVIVTLLNIAGALALIVGLLITAPISLLAMAHAYRTLEHGAHEVVPTGDAASSEAS